MHACRFSPCIEPTFGDHGGQHGQESKEGKEEVSEKEKEVTSQRKPRSSGYSEVRCAFRSLDKQQLYQQNIRRNNGRPDPYADGCCMTVRLFVET
jgi:hypothetical protein